MGYRLLVDATPRSFGSYSVRDIRPSDAEPIRLWRNAQLPILRQSKTLSYGEQLTYFWQVVALDFGSLEPRQILLMLCDDGESVGYGGLTHLDWRARRGEFSFLASPARRDAYASDLRAFLDLLLPIAFEILDLRRVWHETYGRQVSHYVVLEDVGFVEEGRLRMHHRVGDVYHDAVLYGILTGEEKI